MSGSRCSTTILVSHPSASAEEWHGKAVGRGHDSPAAVLMTTLVASLGFVPMALSAGMGAEVQRPWRPW
jgi:hypothetical protein